MDKEQSHELSKSSTIEETTPLLNKKEAVNRYSEAGTSGNLASDSNNGVTSATAGTSEVCESDNANAPETGRDVLEEETLEKLHENNDEVAEHINSYEGMADILSPSFGWGPFCGIWLCLCHCLSSFIIQFPLHILLLGLPISVGFMGVKYMYRCPMSSNLPYAMMAVGVVGCLVLLVRIALLLHTRHSTDERLKRWLKNATTLLECVFLLTLIVELCFSYMESQSDDPFSPNYCEKWFYNFVVSMNDVWIVLVVVWIFLYCLTRQRCMQIAAPI